MRRRLALLGGALAIAAVALHRWLAREGGAPALAPAEAVPDPRAEELRRKLDEARGEQADPAEPETEDTPEERRRRVHEHGRAATRNMKAPTEEGREP